MNSQALKVIVSLLIVLVLLILLIVLLKSNWIRNINFKGQFNLGSYKYIDSDKYSSGNTELSASVVNSLDVDWIYGEINIISYEGKNIIITESDSSMLEEKHRLHYFIEDGVLQIKFVKSGIKKGDINKLKNKKLLIKLPKDMVLNNLNINSILANSNLEGFKLNIAKINSVSGKVNSNLGSFTERFVIQSVSGDINIVGSTKQLELDAVSSEFSFEGEIEEALLRTVSGNIKIKASDTLKKLEMSAVGGNCTVHIPESIGFEAELASIGGSIKCDFPVTVKKDNYIKSGDGSCWIKMNAVSGNLTIVKY